LIIKKTTLLRTYTKSTIYDITFAEKAL